MRSFSYKIFFVILAIFISAATVSAQARGRIVSGDYGSLTIAVDSKGELTGYFDEGTGDDNGRRRFSCTFFIFGEKQSGGLYQISTRYPGGSDIVTGTLKLIGKGAKARVKMHLDGEHGGCWNVVPDLKEEGGVDFELKTAANWEGIRVISAEKAYFFMSPEAKAPQKIFVVRNDMVRILSQKGEWAEVSYVGESGRTTRGWVRLSDFYQIRPPAK